MASEWVGIEIKGSTARVTMNRPERRNALSLEMMLEIFEALDDLEREVDVRAIILAAAGPVFCSGHDLSEMTGRTEAEYQQIFEVCTRLMNKVQSVPQPVIAEVQGMATAAGCQLVATCDLAIASERSAFATPGVRIGLFCTTPMVALSRAIGRKRALQMLLTGEPVDAKTAADWGLVNRVVPADELRAATERLAARISEASACIVATGKRAYYEQIDLRQGDAYTFAQQVMTANAMGEDAHEGITAFLEKRKAHWSQDKVQAR